MSGPFLVEEFHRSRKPAPLTNLLVHGQSVYDKRLPHPFHVWAVLSRRVPPFSETSTAHQSARARSSKSSTVLGNQHRSPICSCTVSRLMVSGCRTPSFMSGPFLVEEFHRSRKPAPLSNLLVHAPLSNLLVHGQSVYDKRLPHPKFHVWAVLSRRVPPFSETSTAHQSARARSVAPLTNLLVHGQSVYDKRLPHPKFHVWAVLSRRVPPFSETSTAHQSARARSVAPLTNLLVHGQSVYDKRLPHPKFHVWAVLSRRVPPFSETSTAHQSARARSVAPLTNLLVHGQSVYDKRLPHPKFHVWAVLSRRVPPFSETSTAHQSARARSSVYDKRLPHPKFHVWPFLVVEFHRSRKPAPLTNLLVHGQSAYDKRLPHPKFHVWAVLSRRVPPFSETSTAHQSARARSVGL
ncbi:hypothetical protein EVAR_70317_1 [Eumeta japonica]|uniref:Uncharacterized protein n=1 Tax=Eumeta variegata TaxID=151549 RepID=A0A4C2A2I8_EUMVA|nr:hypothetical protein EVAR_70317_1 [Eumeta japonica]